MDDEMQLIIHRFCLAASALSVLQVAGRLQLSRAGCVHLRLSV